MRDGFDPGTYDGMGPGQVAPPAGYSVTVTVEHATVQNPDPFQTPAVTCTHTPKADLGLQRITVRVKRNANNMEQQVVIAKRQI